MKTVSESLFEVNGEWWYRQRSGNRQRARIKLCETCNDEFATYPSGETRFCSPKCWRRLCLRCEEPFCPRTKRTVYCSLACKRGIGVCENCGKSYTFSHHGAKRFCSKACFYDYECPFYTIRPRGGGYTIIKVPSDVPGTRSSYGPNLKGWMSTHRYVMQQTLGRTLTTFEHVHHINGQRDDNRPENLELWTTPRQPYGIRSSDYHCPGCRCFEHDSK